MKNIKFWQWIIDDWLLKWTTLIYIYTQIITLCYVVRLRSVLFDLHRVLLVRAFFFFSSSPFSIFFSCFILWGRVYAFLWNFVFASKFDICFLISAGFFFFFLREEKNLCWYCFFLITFNYDINANHLHIFFNCLGWWKFRKHLFFSLWFFFFSFKSVYG